MTLDKRTEYWASLALRHTAGIGPVASRRLLLSYGDAYAAVRGVDGWVSRGLASAAQAESFRSQAWRETAKAEWDLVRARGDRFLLWSDPLYPERLRQIPDPPVLLYHLGDPELLRNPGVAVVGPRRCTEYGRHAAETIGGELARAGITVISGLACGIDREAHLAALEEVGSSIAVLGTGLDRVYPPQNHDVWDLLAENGCIVTEYGPGAPPEAHRFPRRNRVISGLSLGVVVAEAPLRSGGLITARLAAEYDREVFVVDGPPDSSAYAGCRRLIEQGARAVRTAAEVVLELAPLLHAELDPAAVQRARKRAALPAQPLRLVPEPSAAAGNGDSDPQARTAEAADLSPDEGELMALFNDGVRLHIDTLTERLGWEAGRVSRVLLVLEVRGMVRQLPGMRYSLP